MRNHLNYQSVSNAPFLTTDEIGIFLVAFVMLLAFLHVAVNGGSL